MARIIMHLDMDSYFASVEQQVNPALRGKPIGVTGRPTEKSIIVAASREAKRSGLKSGMPVWEARRLCPSLLLVPGHPGCYIEITKRFLDILETFTSRIEVFSIDEVFMDVTQEAPRYGGAVSMARSMKDVFREHLGECVTATIGIASNKTFAKLIAKSHKPDGIGMLNDADLPALLRSTPIGAICGIGRHIEARLNRVGVRTLGELGAISEGYLRREFGVYGLFLKAVGEGRDLNPVFPYTEVVPVKSVGHSRTLPPHLRSWEMALLVLHSLCDRVGRRMRKLGYAGRTVHAEYRLTQQLGSRGKQVTLSAPADDGDAIYAACLSAFRKIGENPEAVAHIGLSARNLVEKKTLPESLLPEERRQDRLNGAVDRIRDRFGESAIRTGDSLLYEPIPEHVSGFTLSNDEWEFAKGGAGYSRSSGTR